MKCTRRMYVKKRKAKQLVNQAEVTIRYADSLANNTRRIKPDKQQGKNEQDTVTRSGMLAKRKIKVSIGLTRIAR